MIHECNIQCHTVDPSTLDMLGLQEDKGKNVNGEMISSKMDNNNVSRNVHHSRPDLLKLT